ncbi:hypothetical protein [Mesorhizobium sp. M0586]|uniref:hypothetical protein n=1 Tax=unclassified Mesorhizobium TaxID=325217 RepID=UPI003335A925
MTGVKAATAEVTRWKLMGLGAFGAAAALASLVTPYWSYLARAAWRITSSIRAAKSAEFHTTSG